MTSKAPTNNIQTNALSRPVWLVEWLEPNLVFFTNNQKTGQNIWKNILSFSPSPLVCPRMYPLSLGSQGDISKKLM